MDPFATFPGQGPFWDEGVAARQLKQLEGVEVRSESFRDETTLSVEALRIVDVLALLRDDPECCFDFLTDVTAVHWPERTLAFEVVYLLYSMERNKRLRVKCSIADGDSIPSVVSLWPTANWLEREVFDMFGIRFDDHPDMRRILMADDYDGWPLRKEFPLKR